MPLYFFDIHDGFELTLDDAGTEFPTDEIAGREAVRVLPKLADDELPDGSVRLFWIMVRRENGEYFFEASLDFKSRWLSCR